MSHAARQLRVRVLEALEERVKQFLRREELWPLRVPRDPLVLGAVALVFVVAGLLACLGPARRATGVDPLVALKAE